MQITIDDQLLQKAGLTDKEVKLMLALALFREGRLSLGQAARLAGMPYLEFQGELGHRKIPIHYDETDLQQDIETLKRLNRI
jgi:predicted HTH domain antitoxin